MNQIGPGYPGERHHAERRQPAAQKQDRGHRAHQDHVGVFAEEEQREGHGAVFDEEAGDDFALAFRQIERRAVGFRQARDEEHDEHREQRQAEPHLVLRQHDVGQVQAADAEQHRDHDEAHRDFVAHHLRRAAHRAQKGIFRIGCPAGDDDAVDAKRADREQIENADVDVGDRPAVIHRDHRPGDHREAEGQHRRHEEQQPVGAGRDDRLLHDHLQRIGKRLQQPERADHVRSLAQLHRGQDLAFGIGQIRDGDQQRHQQRERLGESQDDQANVGVVKERPHCATPQPRPAAWRRKWPCRPPSLGWRG